MFLVGFMVMAFVVGVGGDLTRRKRQNFNFSNNTVPPDHVTCLQSNLCLLPGFCKNNGTCEFKNCTTICKCAAGYIGNTCKNCEYNPCTVPFSVCANNGTCKLDKSTCTQYCLCPEGFTGNSCLPAIEGAPPTEASFEITPSSTGPTATLHPVAERQCEPGFVCIHGVCNEELKKLDQFQCICDDGFLGTLCSRKCEIDCSGDNGECYLNGTIEACTCQPHFEGQRCEKLRPVESNEWVWWVVGSCIVVLVILLLLLIVLPVWLWKKRVVFIMKVVNYFQAYEDEDGKLFDAFISYKSHPDDEEFVLKKIYQKLEKELGFKLCLHFKDFRIGETISNNILWAVENSRRTVLIISPNYLGSEFARFEYQTAQLETLRLRQRIIPIIYKDVSAHKDNIDPTLKNIMQTITYLEWPSLANEKQENKFWKRLVLSLPKRKEVEQKPSPETVSPTNKVYSTTMPSIELLSYKNLNGKSTETVWTDISLDDMPTVNTRPSSNQNGVKSNDVTLQIDNSNGPTLTTT